MQSYETKDSHWAPRTIVYAYYDESLMARAHQHFKPYDKSKSWHSRIGLQPNAAAAETVGSVTLKRIFCSCAPCAPPRYDVANCLVPSVVGRTTTKSTPRSAAAPQVTTQAQALADFSVRLAAGSYWPVCVEKDEQVAEGMYWIAQVQGPAERLVDGMQYAGQTFDAGFIVVKVKWLQLHAERADRSRVYKNGRGWSKWSL